VTHVKHQASRGPWLYLIIHCKLAKSTFNAESNVSRPYCVVLLCSVWSRWSSYVRHWRLRCWASLHCQRCCSFHLVSLLLLSLIYTNRTSTIMWHMYVVSVHHKLFYFCPESLASNLCNPQVDRLQRTDRLCPPHICNEGE